MEGWTVLACSDSFECRKARHASVLAKLAKGKGGKTKARKSNVRRRRWTGLEALDVLYLFLMFSSFPVCVSLTFVRSHHCLLRSGCFQRCSCGWRGAA